ncbi:N-formylglutamate amidohydrolase [Aquabacterium sp.]|uniref:N-formylglutamate amidohydrolase n=1 Tax=Aquabacterium sp. TaxID=1872578 RepID=UPI0037852B92
MGLVWQLTPTGEPIYQRRLSVAEVQRRIDRCWHPYHQALHAACDAALQRFGACWHLNLHSMPANAYERLGLKDRGPLADFVLGDLHGRTCAPAFVDAVRGAMQARGYRVAVNDPYAGQELVRLHGQPAQGRHSLQIEVNRALYMHEPSREPNANFERLQADIGGILAEVVDWIRQRSVA